MGTNFEKLPLFLRMVVLFLVLQLLFMEQLYCSGVGKIKFLIYMDTSDCDDGDIKDSCDFYFKPLTIQDEDGSVLHNIPTTTYTANTAGVDLTKVKELQDPINITVPTNRTVTILTTVWDSDLIRPDDEIRKITDFKVPFEYVSVGDDWEKATTTSTSPNIMTFTVQYKLTQCDDNFTGLGCNFCKTDHFTELCDKYCVPVPGNYTCSSTTGEKICETEKTGDNCDQCVNGKVGQDCDSCRAHYFGEDCTMYCEPDEYYICAGHKICVDNTTGVANNCRQGHKITLPQPVAWISLAGVFLLTTVLITIFAARNFLKRKCTCTNVEPENEYVDNVIARLPSNSKSGLYDESHYSNKELYEL